MSAVVAIGEEQLLAGYALVGVAVMPAEAPDEALAAWESLAPDTELVLLTPRARAALGPSLRGRDVLWAVLPA